MRPEAKGSHIARFCIRKPKYFFIHVSALHESGKVLWSPLDDLAVKLRRKSKLPAVAGRVRQAHQLTTRDVRLARRRLARQTEG